MRPSGDTAKGLADVEMVGTELALATLKGTSIDTLKTYSIAHIGTLSQTGGVLLPRTNIATSHCFQSHSRHVVCMGFGFHPRPSYTENKALHLSSHPSETFHILPVCRMLLLESGASNESSLRISSCRLAWLERSESQAYTCV